MRGPPISLLLRLTALLTMLMTAAAPAVNAGVVWFEDFEDGSVRWAKTGTAIHTANEAFQGSKSQTFGGVTGDGDAISQPIKVEPGSTLYMHVAYKTRGGGGYLGVEELDAGKKKLSSRWLIGDGGCCTATTWAYAVGAIAETHLDVWETRTMKYVVPTTVHWVQIVTEDWSGGLPDDPALGPVFFDVIELSTDPTPVRRCEDPDQDGLCSSYDNCPELANPVQEDLDHDRRGDACDPDEDGDGSLGSDGGGPDCDDRDPKIYPGATEKCDGTDSDCDGDLLEGEPDWDGDGRPDCIDPKPAPPPKTDDDDSAPEEETPEPTPEPTPPPTPPVAPVEPTGCSSRSLVWLALGLALAGGLTAWERRRARIKRHQDPDNTYF